MLQAKFPLSVFGTEVAVPVVRSNKYSLVSSLLNCDTSAHSLHAKKIERQLILVSSMCAKFGVISWSFEWARANFTTEIRLHRIILPIFSDHAHIAYRSKLIWQHFHLRHVTTACLSARHPFAHREVQKKLQNIRECTYMYFKHISLIWGAWVDFT